uniref:MACPF domain-containing protein 8 n=1 Tax=Mytilus galloprovincialis TaxID=29158 RepID=A0A0C5PW29_MYTGA|nr:MACPF domain-containing protein 8 [Mytilus galloprovincialis]
MEYIAVVLLTTLTARVAGSAQYGNGTRFIGLGYNILNGNPDGGDLSQSGIDIGIKTTRHILKLTPDTAKQLIAIDGRTHCTTHNSKSLFYDSKSYQKYLLGDFETFGPGDSSIKPYAFTASTFFKDIDHMTHDKQDAFGDELNICNEGRTRYILPPTYPSLHALNVEFSSAVCQLPNVYNQATYRQFLDLWGTHVIVGVDIGTKSVKRYDQIEILNSVLSSGIGSLATEQYQGYGTVINIDPSKLQHIDTYNINGGNVIGTLQLGTESNPEPVWYNLATIAYFIDDSFWNNGITSENCNGEAPNLSRIQANVVIALTEYPRLNGIRSPPQESILKLALMWPSGSYGLYKPNTGCPKSPFTWLEGWSRQDAEDHHNSNSWTTNIHLGETPQHNKPVFWFCIKKYDDKSTGYYLNWPKGNYCILKKGTCPTGFSDGWLYWDDEDSHNANGHGGTLPDGSYGSNTKIYYCCRNDSDYRTAIPLPVDRPFYLLRFTTPCQKVYGMTVREEVFKMDKEDHHNHNSASGAHPYGSWNSNGDPTLHFCYYQKSYFSGGIFG